MVVIIFRVVIIFLAPCGNVRCIIAVLLCRGIISVLDVQRSSESLWESCIQIQVTRHFSAHLALSQSWWFSLKGRADDGVQGDCVPSGSCPEVSGAVAVKKQMTGLWPAVATVRLQGGGASGACKWWACSGRAGAG